MTKNLPPTCSAVSTMAAAPRPVRRAGVTLVELLVAVAITVAMLLIIGLVFKASTDASGKALAQSEIMQQLRAITRQLERDCAGIRPDLPLLIVWENYTAADFPGSTQADVENRARLTDLDHGDRVVHYDRVVFFTQGDFEPVNPRGQLFRGDLARIFYGQALDEPPLPDPALTPARRFLTRRLKILAFTDWNGILPVPLRNHPSLLDWDSIASNNTYEEAALYDFDYEDTGSGMINLGLFEYAPEAFWFSRTVADFEDEYLVDLPNLINDRDCQTLSFIRRPSLQDFGTWHWDPIQEFLLSQDVTDFRIQVKFDSLPLWFPDERNNLDYTPNLDASNGHAFGVYFNIPKLTGAPASLYTADGNVDWYHPAYFGGSSWPRALKFTFTLYDKHRRHFPEGKTFSYIVELPQP